MHGADDTAAGAGIDAGATGSVTVTPGSGVAVKVTAVSTGPEGPRFVTVAVRSRVVDAPTTGSSGGPVALSDVTARSVSATTVVVSAALLLPGDGSGCDDDTDAWFVSVTA